MNLLEAFGYVASLAIGASLGLIGGGGSILTVPVLVYLFQVDASELAPAHSLFVVGITSLVGGLQKYREGLVDLRTFVAFGMPAIFSVYGTRRFVVPAIPDVIRLGRGGVEVSKRLLVMGLFAVLMVMASVGMIRDGKDCDDDNEEVVEHDGTRGVAEVRKVSNPVGSVDSFQDHEIGRQGTMGTDQVSSLRESKSDPERTDAGTHDSFELEAKTLAEKLTPQARASPDGQGQEGTLYSFPREETGTIKERGRRFNYPLILVEGLLVGALTGLVGAGGGFLVVPALVKLSELPMKKAVGTSLLIIAAKSLFGFVGDAQRLHLDWYLLSAVSALAAMGIFVGNRLSRSMDGRALKRIFGWFVLVMGIAILCKEVI